MVRIKYQAGQSGGQPFKKGESRNVVVINEVLTTPYGDEWGFEGDSLTYTANVKDDEGETLPILFEADLRVNGIKVVDGQAIDVSVYDDTTGDLTLVFIVPDDVTIPVGDYTIQLKWNSQHIDVV